MRRGPDGAVVFFWLPGVCPAACAGYQKRIPRCWLGPHASELRTAERNDATATSDAQLSPTDVSATRDHVLPAGAGSDVSVGMTTVHGQACFGVYADRETLPDASLLALDIDDAIDELLAGTRQP